MDDVTRRSSVVPQYIATIVANLVVFANGLVLGWPSIVLPLLQSSQSPTGHIFTDEDASWIVSSLCLVTIVSIPIYTLLCDRYGRKITGYATGFPYVVSSIILLTTASKEWIYASRAINGLSSAGNFVLIPLYVSEIAQDHIRGTLGVFFVMMFNFGILFAYSIGAVVSYQVLNIIGLIVPIIFLIGFWFLPETPFYLLSNGRTEEAKRSLQWLRGKEADISDELCHLKTGLMKSSGKNGDSFWDLLSQRSTIRGLIIGLTLCVNQQLSGIFVILSYTVSIFTEAGGSLSPHAATIIVGVLQLFGSYLASLLVDRRGRKGLLIASNGVMAICHFGMGLHSYLRYCGVDVSAISWLPVACISIFMVAASLGICPLPFVIMTEIFLPQVQKVATTVGYCLIWFLAFLVSKFFTNISAVLGIYGCYWFFCVSCVLGGIFTIFVIPETKGRSLESILQELSGERRTVKGDKQQMAYTPAATESQ